MPKKIFTFDSGGKMGIKRFDIMHNIGRAKYVVNSHDGTKKYEDGSDFFDIATFKNKKKLGSYIKELKNNGYIENHI